MNIVKVMMVGYDDSGVARHHLPPKALIKSSKQS